MDQRLTDALRIGREAIAAEAAAIYGLLDRVDEKFASAVRLIRNTPGRVVLTGIGKSGHVARKLAATFSSTGTPSFFLHPAEAVHGDLGAVTREDLVIALSYSGESDELSAILPTLKRIPAPIIALVSQPDSSLGRSADVILDISVPKEACPLGLAPTASTAAMLAMGDALAMATMHARAFTSEQFALYHPAGSLGRRLLAIDDVMRKITVEDLAGPECPMTEVVPAMTRTGLGAAMIVDEDRRLVGIITDGDIRRLFTNPGDIQHRRARDVMSANPRFIRSGRLAAEAVTIMQAPPRLLNVLPVLDEDGRVLGATHIQDLVKLGIT